jgi:endonuclease/exonuclease/phosphatase family metal-dependent hydrolase
LALLYNPDRLKNLETDSTTITTLAFDQNSNVPKLRRSMPCCVGRVRQGQEGICAMIDGPAQTDVCNTPSPAGLAQISARSAVARFELAQRKRTTFHVYNVHLPWEGSAGNEWADAKTSVRALIDAVEPNVNRWFPPIIVGDFNNGSETVSAWLTDFDVLGSAPLDEIILTVAGKSSQYTSSATINRQTTVQLPPGAENPKCIDGGRLWSDHCALLTTLVIRDN